MSNLFVIGFDEPHKTEEVRLKLQGLQSEYLLDLKEVVVAVKDQKGKVKLHEAGSFQPADSGVFSGFCGSLTALIFLNATTGAASGALAEVGITHGISRGADSGWFGSFCPDRETVAGPGEGAGRAAWNRRQNLKDLGFARRRGQTAGCFECGEIAVSL